jgi:carbonic anhydrase
VAEKNVRLSMDDIRKRSPILKEMEDQGQIKIVGALYDMKTGRVDFLE